MRADTRSPEHRKMKNLLIVYHSQTCRTETLAHAVYRGATDVAIAGVHVRLLRAGEAGLPELLWADALILGTPENFGYMSGAMKDFLDRTYYPAQGLVEGLAYTIFISAGNDGRGAVSAIQRIARGYPLREVAEPIIVRGEPDAAALAQCTELGMTVAAGLELGLF
ncbi:MAG: NAD(P)H-dependent oxidoreductase [Pseudomonadota bacterium]